MSKGLAFDLGQKEFGRLAGLLKERAGITLQDHKQAMVRSRLSKRLRTLGVGSFSEYCDMLASQDTPELQFFINALTTNLTAFFREMHHFELLKSKILPELVARHGAGSRPIKIWSAGCSSGEEPYSIAMTLAEFFQGRDNWNVEIMASDLDTNILHTAQQGIYPIDRVRDIGDQRLRRWFQKGTGSRQGEVRVIKELRDRIKFSQLNLNDPIGLQGPINIIFCRNVLIYFENEMRKEIFRKFARIQNRNDYFIIGHSETLNKHTNDYSMIGTTAYKRV